MSTETTITSTASTTTPTIAELAARLVAVERSGRRWRMMAVGFAAMLCCVVTMGADAAFDKMKFENEIRARRFTVVDAEGNDVGAFGYVQKDETKGPSFAMTHDGNRKVIALKPGAPIRIVFADGSERMLQ